MTKPLQYGRTSRVGGYEVEVSSLHQEWTDRAARRLETYDDLLAALQGVVRVADRATVEFDAARAAIAKAEGK